MNDGTCRACGLGMRLVAKGLCEPCHHAVLRMLDTLTVDYEQGVIIEQGIHHASEAGHVEMLRVYEQHPAAKLAHLTPRISVNMRRQIDEKTGEQLDPAP